MVFCSSLVRAFPSSSLSVTVSLLRFALPLLVGALCLLPQVGLAQQLTVGPEVPSADQRSGHGGRGGGVTFTQSASGTVERGGVACSEPDLGFTFDNRYFRAFDLGALDEDTDDITVTSVDVGVGSVLLNGNAPVETTLRFHALDALDPDGSFDLADARLLGEQTFVVFEGLADSLVTVEILEDLIVLRQDSLFAIEWFTPSGDPDDTGFGAPYDLRYGANDDGETAPTLLAAPACEIPNPTPLAVIDPPLAERQWVVFVNGLLGAVAGEEGAAPQRVTLGPSFPNPAVGTATVPFTLEAAQRVRLAVFDALGREVAVAVGFFAVGSQTIRLDTRALPAGVYVYRLTAGANVETRKMVVVR